MIGAIIGDIVGSRFEWNNHRSKDFELFHKKCFPTDDSIMSLAVSVALMMSREDRSQLSALAVEHMQGLGRVYKHAGYGGNFRKWLKDEDPKPYGSYGNGSAMRVGPCAFVAESLEEAISLADDVTRVTHNHPEGMKGAEAIAAAAFLARMGKTKEEIRQYISDNYYQIAFTIDGIRDTYRFDESCQGTVPVALEAFFESKSFEDAIRIAISVGGDSDTIGAITGTVAEAYYGVPEEIIMDAIEYLDAVQMELLYFFEKTYPSKAIVEGEDDATVFDILDAAVDKIIPEGVPIEMGEELPGGAYRMYVDPENMIPDFSSFDKKKKFHLPF